MTDNTNTIDNGAQTPPNAVNESSMAQAVDNSAPAIDQKGLISGVVDGIKSVFAKPENSPKKEEVEEKPTVIQMTPEEFEAAVIAKSKEVASEQITNALSTEKLHREVNSLIDDKYKDFAINSLKGSKDLKKDLHELVEKYPEFKKAGKVAGTQTQTGNAQGGVYLNKDAAAIIMAERNRK